MCRGEKSNIVVEVMLLEAESIRKLDILSLHRLRRRSARGLREVFHYRLQALLNVWAHLTVAELGV